MELKDVVDLKDITIVEIFMKFFPNEFPGLLLNKEIKFPIDLMPGIGAISKTPYRCHLLN